MPHAALMSAHCLAPSKQVIKLPCQSAQPHFGSLLPQFMYNLAVAYKLREYVRTHLPDILAQGANQEAFDEMLASWTTAKFDECVACWQGWRGREQLVCLAGSIGRCTRLMLLPELLRAPVWMYWPPAMQSETLLAVCPPFAAAQRLHNPTPRHPRLHP